MTDMNYDEQRGLEVLLIIIIYAAIIASGYWFEAWRSRREDK